MALFFLRMQPKVPLGVLGAAEMRPDLRDHKTYPGMTRWFDPVLLIKLLWNVIVSGVFAQYADRRLIIAALDTCPSPDLIKRAEDAALKPAPDGTVWLDFVADLGDGFDSTYAVALLAGAQSLSIDGLTLPRGQALVFGGDEVYPTATAAAYSHQMGDPYKFALPDPNPKSPDGIPVYAVPGNHDWYDGLVHFLAFFGRHKSWHMGAWRTSQRRSYFALKLTDKWWIWCTDIQLADDMDQPQADYFKIIAEGMPRDTKIILCSAEPGWLYTKTNRKSFEIVDYAAQIAHAADRNLSIPILLSGDTHHYSRYASEDGLQFITSGGGGAFLHPTHQLEDEIEFVWVNKKTKVSLKRDPSTNKPTDNVACYPTRDRSRTLLWRNLWFPITNWDFALGLGVIYWIFSVAVSLRHSVDMYVLAGAIFIWAFVGYTRRQEKSDACAVYISGILQGLAHTYTLVKLTNHALFLNEGHFNGGGPWDVWLWLMSLAGEVGLPGGVIGAAIFGVNLLVTCRFFRLNTNDAFSALRLDTYKNFLRIKITGDEVTIYPIGLDKVPKRSEWTPSSASGGPLFDPPSPLRYHLIEKPITWPAKP
jgi:hypothetical protein